MTPEETDQLKALKSKPASNYIYVEVLGFYLLMAGCIFFVSRGISVETLSAAALLGAACAFVIIGWSQFCLLNGQHEGLHYNFGAKHNELLFALLTLYPIGFTLKYRDHHWRHHQSFGKAGLDPDFANYASFPKDRFEFLGLFVKNSTGLAAVKQFIAMKLQSAQITDEKAEKSSNDEEGASAGLPWELMKLSAVQMVILLAFVAAFSHHHFLAGIPAYVIFWMLPLATVAKLCSSTRTFCEHAAPSGKPVFRTIVGNVLEVAPLGWFNFNYHAQHHKNPSVPYHLLPELEHIEKMPDKIGPIEYHLYKGGYLRLLGGWFEQLPWRAEDSPKSAIEIEEKS